MKPMLKVSAAVLIAAISAFPMSAYAAADTASVVMGTKTEIVPVGNLVDMIGKWTAGDLTFLDKAAEVKVFDTKTLYPDADLKQIASAETAGAAGLTKFRDAIRADSALDAWFIAHNLDPARVIAVADPKGQPEIFLY